MVRKIAVNIMFVYAKVEHAHDFGHYSLNSISLPTPKSDGIEHPCCAEIYSSVLSA